MAICPATTSPSRRSSTSRPASTVCLGSWRVLRNSGRRCWRGSLRSRHWMPGGRGKATISAS